MINSRKAIIVTAILLMIYLLATQVNVMDADASQYAAMSREMKESGSYLQVYEQGRDYLDKPPFLFWVSSLSMQIFGENNFAYKLPSILFTLLAIYATFKFTQLFYHRTIALLAALVLGSCQATFLITNDVRTDTILMAWVIIGIWQLTEWLVHKKSKHFVLGAAAIGFGMLTKGPIALLVPIFALGSHIISTKQWNYIVKPIYLLGIGIIGLILLPMMIGLYQQFDLHPEKTVNGLQNVSGLKFYFWTQSFGRITGENVWNNNAPFSFLFENLLWGMLPWTLFFVAGLVHEIYLVFKRKFFILPQEEFITTGGFIITYCSLGLSKYQLPHYIYVVLPFIAIITAKMMYKLLWQQEALILKKIIAVIQSILIFGLITGLVLICLYTFTPTPFWPWLIIAATASTIIVLLIKKSTLPKLFSTSLALIIGVNIFLASWFYPQLLQYQLGNIAADFYHTHQLKKGSMMMYKTEGVGESIHFYTKQIVPTADSVIGIKPNVYVVTSPTGLRDIEAEGIKYTVEQKGVHFHVSELNGPMLNANTRNNAALPYFIIKTK